MLRSVVVRCCALAFVAFSGAAVAEPITFIFTGIDDGTLNGVPFTDTTFTITQIADTAAEQSCGGACRFIDASGAMVNLGGLGTFTLDTGTRTFITGDVIGLSRAGVNGGDLMNGSSSSFVGYDLTTSLGPVAYTGGVTQWSSSFGAVETSGGTLFLADANVDATFQAIVGVAAVPEPEGLLLLGIGAFGFALVRRRR